MKVVKEVPLAASFCTGTQSSCPAPSIEPDSALDPDGPLAYSIRQRLDEGHGLKQIAAALDVTWMQVLDVAQTVSSPDFVIKGDHYDDDVTPHDHVQMEDDQNEV
jgi:hypothetical protein